jgi:alkanesulfonate monooxygenase SsuD/methylene tetrahydromethanopterin reductase-like flavin-dependent oxidoreductase (luciferase family)
VARALSAAVMPLENRRDQFVLLATLADELGYDGVMFPETWSYDITVLLAEIAVKTRRVRLGTGILGVWNRSAATIAMAAATLASQSNGRFILGLGASTPQLVEGLHDVPFEPPLPRMRRTVMQIRALLRGERVPLAVTTTARALRLNVPVTDVPIYLAALGDASIRLAGELADGWIPFLFPLRLLPHGIEQLREGARRSGRAELPIVCPSLPTVVHDDPLKAREGAAWFVSFYVTAMGTFYRDSLVRWGFAKEIEAVVAANTPKFAGLVPPDAEELLEQLIVFGTPAEARRRLQRWYDAGGAMPALLLRAGLTPEETRRSLEAFAPMLR